MMPLKGIEVPFPWVVYYNDQAPSSAFDPFNPIIFDPDVHPDLQPLLEKGKEVLGYVNLAEVEEWREYFGEVKSWGILIEENPDWPGSWSVDIRDKRWSELLLKRVIPSILDQGFNGLFYDQVDVVIELEKADPSRFSGMKVAIQDLVQSIDQRYPEQRKMLNRAFELLNALGPFVDYELGEMVFTFYDYEKKTYHMRTKEDYEWGLKYINDARKKYPHLVVFSLDYWEASDIQMIKKIYNKALEYCLRPYVSTIELDEVVPLPSKK